MALVNRPNLTAELSISDTCLAFTVTDKTGLYNATTNPNGYGLTGGPNTTDISKLVIAFYYSSIKTYITYTFTISSGTITAATVAIGTGSTTNILSKLSTTNWYTLLSNGFNLNGDYGVTLPTVEDGIYEVEYTISGTYSGTSFAFTTSDQCMNDCKICCSINKKFIEIDPSCECFERKMMYALTAETYLSSASNALDIGDITKAISALQNAVNAAACDCKC